MIYRLKELKGDTIAVPQLIFSKLGIAEEYNVRVALYVLDTKRRRQPRGPRRTAETPSAPAGQGRSFQWSRGRASNPQ